jgi:hypothetical protein
MKTNLEPEDLRPCEWEGLRVPPPSPELRARVLAEARRVWSPAADRSVLSGWFSSPWLAVAAAVVALLLGGLSHLAASRALAPWRCSGSTGLEIAGSAETMSDPETERGFRSRLAASRLARFNPEGLCPLRIGAFLEQTESDSFPAQPVFLLPQSALPSAYSLRPIS